jgi:hypothetical protein
VLLVLLTGCRSTELLALACCSSKLASSMASIWIIVGGH